MRLLQWNDTGDICLGEEVLGQPPPYAILSHTWGPKEVVFQDLQNGTAKDKLGYEKLRFCGTQARRDGIHHFWVDTCCIDKTSSAELSEAINSMFRWYRDAEKCYVYLSDVSRSESETSWETAFRRSRWWTRGWTLQEFLAPSSVEFFDETGTFLGNKTTLELPCHGISEIPVEALRGKALREFTVPERMAWIISRDTTRPEDQAYSLLGIFGVNLPLIYGEGKKSAFHRLRKEIDTALENSISIEDVDECLSKQCYNKERLQIERLSGDKLPMEKCFINLAIVEQPVKMADGTDGLNSKGTMKSSPFTLSHPLRIEHRNEEVGVELLKLFNSRKDNEGRITNTTRVLIRGRAGVGKTTLCKKIVSDFKNGTLWRDRFDRILWVPLRTLKSWNPSQFDLESFFLYEYFSAQKEGKSLAKALNRVVQQHMEQGGTSRTLFLLDGLDEVSQYWNSDEPKYKFLVGLLNQPNIIVTSRPHGKFQYDSVRQPFHLELETIGFYSNQVEEYLQHTLDSTKSSIIRAYLRQHDLIQDLVRIPILLDALCYTWNFFQHSVNKTITIPNSTTGFYQAIEQNLWKKDVVRLGKRHGDQLLTDTSAPSFSALQVEDMVYDEIRLLGCLAFTGLYNETVDFSPETRNTILEKFKARDGTTLPDQTLRRLSFLRTSESTLENQDINYHFLHLTFQEYFAARHFVTHWVGRSRLQCLNLDNKRVQSLEPNAFIQKHKYDARFDVFWRFVAGLIDKTQREKTCSFFNILEKQPDLLGPVHQRLIIHCLNEVSSDMALWKTLEGIFTNWILFEDEINESASLAYSSEWSNQVLITALRHKKATETMLGNIFVKLDNHQTLPTEALRIIIKLLAQKGSPITNRMTIAWGLRYRQDFPQELVHIMITIVKDKEEDSRFRALVAMVLCDRKDLPTELLQIMITLLRDNKETHSVRANVAEALSNQQDFPEELFQIMITILRDKKEDRLFRRDVARVLGNRQDLPLELFQIMITLLREKEKGFIVRSGIAEALSNRQDFPQELFHIMITLLRKKEEHLLLRARVAKALSNRRDLPQELLQIMITLLQDKEEDYLFRGYVAEALGNREDVPTEVIQIMVKLLEDEGGDVSLRARIARMLGKRQGSAIATRQNLVINLDNRTPHIRTMIIQALDSTQDLSTDTLQILLEFFEDGNDEVRQEAMGLLCKQRDLPDHLSERLLQALIVRLSDEFQSIQILAANLILKRFVRHYITLLLGPVAKPLYMALLRLGFDEQWSWYIEGGTSYLITPEGVITASISHREVQELAVKLRPDGYPLSGIDRKHGLSFVKPSAARSRRSRRRM